MLAPDEAVELARLLEAERLRLGRQVASLELTYRELVDAADLEPPDDEHDPDGTTAYERAQVGSLGRASRHRLDEIAAALGQLGAGAYGRCEQCGEPIGFARLKAVLGATRCVRCASS